MTEPPHPHFPSSTLGSTGPNAFQPPHPHNPYPSGPWVHQHHYGYNTHWGAYRHRRFKGRLVWFALGAGATALYFREKKPHGENCFRGWGHSDSHSYPAPVAGTGVVAGPSGGEVAPSYGRPHYEHDHRHWGWRWRSESSDSNPAYERRSAWAGRTPSGASREELEPRRVPVPASMAGTTADTSVESRPVSQQTTTTTAAEEDKTASNHGWNYWGQQDAVRGATGAVSYSFQTSILSISPLHLELDLESWSPQHIVLLPYFFSTI